MHISLDSALGQQRRLNQVGESITQIAPDPAAAYSLRSLTGGDPKVVRVRRESDNHEQDFTASEVSSGALVDFVNAQVTAPLDIQALTATGRDGDFLIAKAAYSLRSLGTRQATLAATGDTVARADGKYVCQVRRDSDDALKSFTADEVTDGTLLSFVNEDVTVYTSTFADDANGWSSGNQGTAPSFNQTVGGVSPAISWTGEIGTYYAKSTTVDNLLELGQKVRITGKAFSSTSTTLKTASNFNTVLSSPSQDLVGGEWTDFDFTISMDGFGGSQARIGLAPFSSGTAISSLASGVTFALADITVQIVEANGFVKTWYDQSVTTQAGDTATGNHATQATAANQPKIVSAGALLTAGVTFDGSDDHFDFTEISNSGAFSLFIASNITNNGGMVLGDNAGASNYVRYESANAVCKIANTEYDFGDSRDTSLDIINFNRDGSNSLSANRNAAAIGSPQTATGTFDINLIGVRNNDVNPITGAIKELLIYSSDQSSNRSAVEANIMTEYSIS